MHALCMQNGTQNGMQKCTQKGTQNGTQQGMHTCSNACTQPHMPTCMHAISKLVRLAEAAAPHKPGACDMLGTVVAKEPTLAHGAGDTTAWHIYMCITCMQKGMRFCTDACIHAYTHTHAHKHNCTHTREPADTHEYLHAHMCTGCMHHSLHGHADVYECTC